MLLIIAQLAQDDDGNFEIASFGGSLDEEADDPMANSPPQQPYARVDGQGRDVSRANAKTVSGQQDRSSLDGETIFAIGEEGDKLSDDEDSLTDSPRRGLTS